MEGSQTSELRLVEDSREPTLGRLDALENFVWSWQLWVVVAGIFVIIVVWSYLPVTRRQGEAAKVRLPAAIQTLCASLLARAQRLRGWAGISLLAAFVVLMVGGYFIVFLAPGLAVRDELVRQRSTVAFEAVRLKSEIEQQIRSAGPAAWYQLPAAPNVSEFIFLSDDLKDMTAVMTDNSIARSRDGGRTWGRLVEGRWIAARRYVGNTQRFKKSVGDEVLEIWIDFTSGTLLAYGRQSHKIIGYDLSNIYAEAGNVRAIGAIESPLDIFLIFAIDGPLGANEHSIFYTSGSFESVYKDMRGLDTNSEITLAFWPYSNTNLSVIRDAGSMFGASCRSEWCSVYFGKPESEWPQYSILIDIDENNKPRYQYSPSLSDISSLSRDAKIAITLLHRNTIISIFSIKNSIFVFFRQLNWEDGKFLFAEVPELNTELNFYRYDFASIGSGDDITILNPSGQVLQLHLSQGDLNASVQTPNDLLQEFGRIRGPFWSYSKNANRIYFVIDGTRMVRVNADGTRSEDEKILEAGEGHSNELESSLENESIVNWQEGGGGYITIQDTGVFFGHNKLEEDYLIVKKLSPDVLNYISETYDQVVVAGSVTGAEAEIISLGESGAFARNLYSTDLSSVESVEDLLRALKTILPPEYGVRYAQEARALEAAVKDSDKVTLLEDGNDSFEERLLSFVGHETLPRIIVLVVTFFIVQLLIRMFQYNTRLAAFHEARADAILAVAGYGLNVSPAEFSQLVSVLSPDLLDFNKAQKTQLHEAAELTKALLARAEHK